MARELALQEPNEAETAFILSYIETGSQERAAVAAGYEEKAAKSAAWRMLSRPHVAWALAVETRKRLATAAPMALRTLQNLASKGESEKVRLEAAKALLDRGGYVAPRATLAPSKEEKPLHEQSTEELQGLAARLESELAGRAKPVNSATAAPQDVNSVDLIG